MLSGTKWRTQCARSLSVTIAVWCEVSPSTTSIRCLPRQPMTAKLSLHILWFTGGLFDICDNPLYRWFIVVLTNYFIIIAETWLRTHCLCRWKNFVTIKSLTICVSWMWSGIPMNLGCILQELTVRGYMGYFWYFWTLNYLFEAPSSLCFIYFHLFIQVSMSETFFCWKISFRMNTFEVQKCPNQVCGNIAPNYMNPFENIPRERLETFSCCWIIL